MAKSSDMEEGIEWVESIPGEAALAAAVSMKICSSYSSWKCKKGVSHAATRATNWGRPAAVWKARLI